MYMRQWSRPSTRKRNAKRFPDEALQRAEKRREAKGKGEKERYTHLNTEFQRIAKRWKSLPQWSMLRGRGKNKMGKTREERLLLKRKTPQET